MKSRQLALGPQMRVQMSMGVAMAMPARFRLGGDQIDRPVPHAGLRDRLLRELLHCGCAALQEDRLQAMVMIEVRMHRRHDQIVMLMLCRHQPVGQRLFVMVVDVADHGHAVRRCVARDLLRFERLPDEVTYRLRSTAITLAGNHLIELMGERVIERDRKAFHGDQSEWRTAANHTRALRSPERSGGYVMVRTMTWHAPALGITKTQNQQSTRLLKLIYTFYDLFADRRRMRRRTTRRVQQWATAFEM